VTLQRQPQAYRNLSARLAVNIVAATPTLNPGGFVHNLAAILPGRPNEYAILENALLVLKNWTRTR
jgi:hypothetical protein